MGKYTHAQIGGFQFAAQLAVRLAEFCPNIGVFP